MREKGLSEECAQAKRDRRLSSKKKKERLNSRKQKRPPVFKMERYRKELTEPRRETVKRLWESTRYITRREVASKPPEEPG
jgi:hypothetical protein